MNFYECIKTCPLAKQNSAHTIDIKRGIPIFVSNIENKELYFSPVGNIVNNPSVIICGQTPDKTTMKKFYSYVASGISLEYSGTKIIYSNTTMRKNLFIALQAIGFFEYMKKINPYWKNNNIDLSWNSLFEKNNITSGVQLTQSCNCAIIEGNSSKQPSKAVISKLSNSAPACLFNSFRLSDNLKLIIFLDSPSNDGRYHQIDFFKKTEMYKWCIDNNVKIISIPHPSGANRIYNNHKDLCTNKYIINSKNVICQLLHND